MQPGGYSGKKLDPTTKGTLFKDEPYGQDYILSCTYRIGALNPMGTAECMHALPCWNRIKNKLRNHSNTTVNRLCTRSYILCCLR